jgi:hypothetical protein
VADGVGDQLSDGQLQVGAVVVEMAGLEPTAEEAAHSSDRFGDGDERSLDET